MNGQVYVTLLLGMITCGSPSPNPLDKININLNLEDKLEDVKQGNDYEPYITGKSNEITGKSGEITGNSDEINGKSAEINGDKIVGHGNNNIGDNNGNINSGKVDHSCKNSFGAGNCNMGHVNGMRLKVNCNYYQERMAYDPLGTCQCFCS